MDDKEIGSAYSLDLRFIDPLNGLIDGVKYDDIQSTDNLLTIPSSNFLCSSQHLSPDNSPKNYLN
jgi:hypothetical protein